METLMSKIGFDKEEKEYVNNLLKNLDKNIFTEFDELKKLYFMTETDLSQAECCTSVKNALSSLCEKVGCHEYSIRLIFLLYCCDDLKKNYDAAHIDEQFYYDMISDITCKLRERRALDGIIGVSSLEWFHNPFLMKLFALGRFQYVKWKFTSDKPYHVGNITINPGDPVYNIHIPSGGSMTKEKRYDSYKKAFEFFGKKKGDYIVLACESWLLYEPNRNIFPEGSNLMGFLNDFDILRSFEYPQVFRDSWRVFNKHFDGDTSILPCNTTLQKNFIKWLDEGNKVGGGYGIIIFDGERIVNN